MKKLLTALTSSLLIAVCLASCSNTSDIKITDDKNNVQSEENSPNQQSTEADEEVTESAEFDFTPDEAKEEDFVGKWECHDVLLDEGLSDVMNGIPAKYVIQITINADHTASATPGIEGETSKAEFEWTFRDNKFIPIIEGEEADVYYILQNGELVANIGENSSVYFCNKVDEFSFLTTDELNNMISAETENSSEDTAE